LARNQVNVPDFLTILDLVKPKDGEVFVDLGSGTGKAVLAASCGFPEFSKCRGIELVPGLANAAANHLSAAKNLLDAPQTPVTSVASANGTEAKLPSEKWTALLPGVSRKVCSAERTGKNTSTSKGTNQGLSACDLEALIAHLLVRNSALLVSRGDRPEATAEEIAAWLVRELGHRRQVDGYKSSLRGYGGFQKFLVARRGASNVSSCLLIAEDGARVAIAPTETDLLSEGRESTPPECDILPTDKETTRGQERAVGPESLPSLAVTTTTGAATVAAAASVPGNCRSEVDDGDSFADGARHPSSTCAVDKASTAASSLTSSRSGSSFLETNYRGGNACGIGGKSKINAERRLLPEQGPLTAESLSRVELVCGDIFQEAWDDASVVFVASLLFDNSMMALLAKCMKKLRKGARVISLKPIPAVGTSGDIPLQEDGRLDACGTGVQRGVACGEVAERSAGLKLLDEGFFRMSWQMARVYIYERL
ncbi:unnamed protein product, partial [Hapterophycus canaliculatus]